MSRTSRAQERADLRIQLRVADRVFGRSFLLLLGRRRIIANVAKNDWRDLLKASTLTREALRDAYRIALIESGVATSVQPVAGDPLRLDCQTKQGRPFTVGLDNLFADASRSGRDDREGTLQRYLAASVETA